MDKLDLKFNGIIKKIKDESIVPDDQYMVFLAKDNAFPDTLNFYRDKCVELDCDKEHIAAVDKTILRLNTWRLANKDKLKKADAKGEKLFD